MFLNPGGSGFQQLPQAARSRAENGRLQTVNSCFLRFLKTVTEAGGIICPAVPSFYSLPKTIEEVVKTVVDRVIDLAGLENESYRWND